MTNEEKDLLFKDLCARLPYGVKALETYYEEVVELICICPRTHNIEAEILSRIGKDNSLTIQNIQFFKPYLRPMSSMTEKELEEYMDLIIPVDGGKAVIEEEKFIKVEDFYNQHLLDYRGLIPKGLALEAKEGMYNIENI